MSKKKSLKKNMLMSTILTISNFIFPLITYSYVIRVITPIGIGKVAFVDSILQYFLYIAQLGIPAYGLRECAKVRDDSAKLSTIVQELIIINLVSTLTSYVLLFVSVIVVPKFYNYRDLFIIMSVTIILKSLGIEWLYQALEEYSYITIRSLIFKTISVFLTFILIKDFNDYIWYGFLFIFTVSASNICNFINAQKIVSFRKTLSYNFNRHIKSILTLFSASIIVGIYSNFDVSMLGFINTEREVGLYNSALKIKAILLSLSTAITSVIIPRMAYYIKNKSVSNSYALVIKSMRISFLLAIPVAIFVFIFPNDLLIFIGGKECVDAALTLRVLMLCILPLVLTNLFGNQILIPLGKEKRYSQSVFVGLFINLGLNCLLIPKWGSYGAALGTLATEIWNAIWMASGAMDFLKLVATKINYWTYAISLLLSSILSLFVSKYANELNVFFRLCCSASIYFVVYYVMMFIFKEPIIMSQKEKIISKLK